MKSGDIGGNVFELQKMLIGWGSKDKPMILDGDFGSTTESAVMRFQEAHGLLPDGIVQEETIRFIQLELQSHPINFKNLKCKCGQCDGFGSERYGGKYREGKPHIEAYCMYEYPGIDDILIWAVRALMHRAELNDGIAIRSGYRCWYDNDEHGRQSTNHMGKAIDFISSERPHDGSSRDKIECTECARIRNVGIDCGFQIGWGKPGRISLEPGRIAPTWVHIDSRMIPANTRQHVNTSKGFIAIRGIDNDRNNSSDSD